MNNSNTHAVDECLKGKTCKDCIQCQADKESWAKLEQDFSQGNGDFATDLQIYYTVRGKRKIFQQEKKGGYLTLSEPESLSMFSRF